jgi:hypothetical protein
MGAYVEPDVITEEERAIQMGDSVSEEVAEEVQPEGAGTLEAEKPVQETEKPAVEAAATETKDEPEKLTEDEKKDIEAQGFKIETDRKGRTYITDAEGLKIPEKRFGKIYREGKEAETLRQENEELKTKQTLIKQLGQEEYFKLYPEEAPEGWKPQEPKKVVATQIPEGFNVLDLNVTGGAYDGHTLREVMQIDPDEGTRMLNAWKDNQHAEIRKQEETAAKDVQRRANDAGQFEVTMAKELFGVEDTKSLTKEQGTKIVLLGQQVLDWQIKNDRLGLTFNEAYFLMNREGLIKTAGEKGAANALKGLQRTGPPSIDAGNGGATVSEWDTVSRMSIEDLDKHIDSLDDKGLTKFLKEAPASIRAKHPMIDWK